MTSHASLKELTKALSAFIPNPTHPLPEELIETIEAYLRKHPKYDGATADRLQEDLHTLFEKHVRPHLNAAGAWIGILRRLLPMIHTPERMIFWMDNFKGMMTRAAYDKVVVDEITVLLTDLVELANEYTQQCDSAEETNPVMQRIFIAWMERFYPAIVEGVLGMEYNERIFREALVQFAKKQPKQFFTSLDGFFVQKPHREAALRFLCDYVQTRPPHVYQIIEVPLFNNLLICLQQDTSTAILSAALTALTMLLPNMPSSLVPYLPALFNIYARLLFWDQDKTQIRDVLPSGLGEGTQWEIYPYAEGIESTSITHLSSYYTILYGLYPLNFMDYIRKPQRYLRHANVPNADDIEVQPTEIRQLSEQFRQRHFLHPNFYTLTIDSEKADFGRFIKSEPSQVVAECMALCMPEELEFLAARDVPATAVVQSPVVDNKGEGIMCIGSIASDFQLDSHQDNQKAKRGSLSQNLRKQASLSSLSTRVRGYNSTAAGGMSWSSQLPCLTSHSHLQDMVQSNKVARSGFAQAIRRNHSEASLSFIHREVPPKHIPVSHTEKPLVRKESAEKDAHMHNEIAYLQRQILMAQNDLSFERYQKQQHMAHIANLRRKQVITAATEAETQKIIMMNRSMKSRAEEAKSAAMQARKEAEKTRALAKKWEATLSNKLKKLREELEKANGELQQVKSELQASQEETDKLRKLICVAEVKELNWKQNLQSGELHSLEVDRLKAEVERLSMSEHDDQAKERERHKWVENAAKADRKAEELEAILSVKEWEMKNERRAFASQIEMMRMELEKAQAENRRLRTDFRTDMQEVLSGSRARQTELQQRYDLLQRKLTALQSSILAAEPGNTQERIRTDATSQDDSGQHLLTADDDDGPMPSDDVDDVGEIEHGLLGQSVSGISLSPPSPLPPQLS